MALAGPQLGGVSLTVHVGVLAFFKVKSKIPNLRSAFTNLSKRNSDQPRLNAKSQSGKNRKF